MSVSNSPLTVFLGQTTTFSGTVSALNGYTNSLTLSCVAGTTCSACTCSPSPSTLTPGTKTPFTVTVAGPSGDYNFNLQGAGSDPKHVTHQLPLTLHVVNLGMIAPSPANVTVSRGTTASR